MKGRNYRLFILYMLLAIAAALLTTILAAAEERAFASSNTLIKDLLAGQPGQAVCFKGKFKTLKVNVWDYAKAKHVPVPGLFQFGKQVTRPEPAVYAGQEVASLTLLIAQGRHESKSWDETHDFRLKVTLKGWRGALYSAGDCPYRRTDRPADGMKANTTKLYCGVACDGGRMDVERVPGSRAVFFRFDRGGLRMSRSCGEEGDLHLGGSVKPYDPAPDDEEAPVAFQLSRMTDKACAAFRRATDGPND